MVFSGSGNKSESTEEYKEEKEENMEQETKILPLQFVISNSSRLNI